MCRSVTIPLPRHNNDDNDKDYRRRRRHDVVHRHRPCRTTTVVVVVVVVVVVLTVKLATVELFWTGSISNAHRNIISVVECMVPPAPATTSTSSAQHSIAATVSNVGVAVTPPPIPTVPTPQKQQRQQQQKHQQRQKHLPPAKLILRQIRSQKKQMQQKSKSTSTPASTNNLTTFVVDILSQLMPAQIDDSTAATTPNNTTTNATTTAVHPPLDTTTTRQLDGSYSTVVVEALSIFGKSNRSDLVLEWYHRWNDYHHQQQQQQKSLVTMGKNRDGLSSSRSSSISSEVVGDNNDDVVVVVVPTYDENVRSMAISALGYCGRHVDAVRLLLPHQNSTTRSSASKAHRGENTTTTYNNNEGFSSSTFTSSSSAAGSYNAAIAACKDAQDWELALEVFETMVPPELVSTITVNAVMSVLLASRQGQVALDLLDRIWKSQRRHDNTMETTTTTVTKASLVDGVSFQLVTSALIRSGEVDQAYNLLQRLLKHTDKEEQKFLKINSIEPICDLLASAYERRSNWDAVRRVEELRTSMNDDAGLEQQQQQPQQQYRSFQHWDGLEKVNKGKKESWVVGTYWPLNITVGLHPNRNPSKNGIQIVFYSNERLAGNDDSTWDRTKIGYLLMQNSVVVKKTNEEEVIKGTSSLLGMFLERSQRGKGLAKICFALWIWFCLRGGIEPCTGIIRKPLISLTLQKSFGFVPLGDGGVDVELSPDPSDPTTTILYCPSGKCLEGAFSPWDLEKQGIRLASSPPVKRGKTVRVGCALSPPKDEGFLRRAVQEYVGFHDDDHIEGTSRSEQPTWECKLTVTRNEIRRLFLGI